MNKLTPNLQVLKKELILLMEIFSLCKLIYGGKKLNLQNKCFCEFTFRSSNEVKKYFNQKPTASTTPIFSKVSTFQPSVLKPQFNFQFETVSQLPQSVLKIALPNSSGKSLKMEHSQIFSQKPFSKILIINFMMLHQYLMMRLITLVLSISFSYPKSHEGTMSCTSSSYNKVIKEFKN